MTKVIKSAKAFFEAANQQPVIATLVGGFSYEDWDQQVEAAKQQCIKNNVPESDITITDETFTIKFKGTERFMKRSKIRRVRTGIMDVRSQRYLFINDEDKSESWGEKKGAKVVDGKLEIETLMGTKIVYELAQAEVKQAA